MNKTSLFQIHPLSQTPQSLQKALLFTENQMLKGLLGHVCLSHTDDSAVVQHFQQSVGFNISTDWRGTFPH